METHGCEGDGVPGLFFAITSLVSAGSTLAQRSPVFGQNDQRPMGTTGAGSATPAFRLVLPYNNVRQTGPPSAQWGRTASNSGLWRRLALASDARPGKFPPLPRGPHASRRIACFLCQPGPLFTEADWWQALTALDRCLQNYVWHEGENLLETGSLDAVLGAQG